MNIIVTYLKQFFKNDFVRIIPYLVIVILLFFLYFSGRTIISQKKDIVTYSANMKAYDAQLSSVRKDCQMFSFTRDQLLTLNDSLIGKLLDKSKELGIKTSKIEQLQYIKSKVIRKDSIILKRDTIFKEPSFKLDTIIGDKWCSTSLSLRYPSVIRLSSVINSEKFIIVSARRETVNPPKKFFLFRLFQKKHTVIDVTVKDNNPYIINGEQKFIKIMK